MPNTAPPFSLHPLYKSFVGPKPIDEAPEDHIRELESADKLIIERKRNGHGGLVATTGFRHQYVELYSRGVHELTRKFPDIVDELRGMSIPPNSLLAGELVLSINGIDDPDAFNGLAKSSPANAIQKQKTLGPVRFALFNVIVHKGKSVIKLPYGDRLDIIRELTARRRVTNVNIVDIVTQSFEQAKATVKEREWEGLVLYDKGAGSKYRLDGRTDDPPRPPGCWRWKPYKEGDFVATGWIPSDSKKFKGLVKDLLIAQRDPITKEFVSCGKVGNGLTPKQKRDFADDALYPMVFEVKFLRRTLNNRLISASVLRHRTDKEPVDCFSPPVQKK